MGQPLPETEKSTIDPWVGADGVVAHPDAPVGGGGPGVFRSPSLLGNEGDLRDSVPHPLAPAARYLDQEPLNDKAEELQDAQQPQKPAPVVTKEEKKTVNGVQLTIKADENNASGVKAAETKMPVTTTDPPEAIIDNATNKVIKIEGAAPVISAIIQTRYGSGTSPDGKSAYGRGTTDDDKKNGNTSLGFHESCHRQDFQDFLKNNAPPKFKGKVGMTKDEYAKALEEYSDAVNDYQDKASEFSGKQTDEVGNPPKSKYSP